MAESAVYVASVSPSNRYIDIEDGYIDRRRKEYNYRIVLVSECMIA